MHRCFIGLAVLVVLTLGPAVAHAAALTDLNKRVVIENGGTSYDPTTAEEALIGLPSGTDYLLGPIGLRADKNPFAVGDTFDTAAVLASLTSGAGNVAAVLNAASPDLAYVGGIYAPLGTTVINKSGRIVQAFFVAYEKGQNVVFGGTSTLGGGRFEPLPTELAPVPIPGAALLLGTGLAGLAYVRRRRAA